MNEKLIDAAQRLAHDELVADIWGPPIPDWVTAAIPSGAHQIGMARYGDEVVYFVPRRI